MNITLPTDTTAALEAEANRRNASLEKDATPFTAESIALNLLDKAATSYTHAAQDAYVRALYTRIQTAPAATQQAIFAAAEQSLAAATP